VSENQVLHGDPRHQVEDFRKEVLGRAALVVGEMGCQLERVVRRTMECLAEFKSGLLLVGFKGIQVQKTTWTLDGVIEVTFSVDRPVPPDPDLYHLVVDAFVDDVLSASDVPAELRRELGGMVRGLATQFAVLKKHNMLDLRRVTFEDFRWVEFNVLAFNVLHDGKRLRPRDVGW